MTRILALALLTLSLALPAARAAAEEDGCHAEYKARRGPPLELHYGVIALDGAACRRRGAAEREIAERIAVDGWTLLKLMDVFVVGDTVTPRQFRRMETDAGPYFLRY